VKLYEFWFDDLGFCFIALFYELDFILLS